MARLHSPGCRGLSSSLLGTFLAISCLILLPTLWLLYEPRGVETSAAAVGAPSDSRIIMGKLGNATAKAELGRASCVAVRARCRADKRPGGSCCTPWPRVILRSRRPISARLCPTSARWYPRDSLTGCSLHLFARLYPCGECAAEFAALLDQYPPQVCARLVVVPVAVSVRSSSHTASVRSKKSSLTSSHADLKSIRRLNLPLRHAQSRQHTSWQARVRLRQCARGAHRDWLISPARGSVRLWLRR